MDEEKDERISYQDVRDWMNERGGADGEGYQELKAQLAAGRLGREWSLAARVYIESVERRKREDVVDERVKQVQPLVSLVLICIAAGFVIWLVSK